jgi:hypothetical protein
MFRVALALCALAATANAWAQTDQTGSQAFDECGVLVQGAQCVLFQGAGGLYYVPDTGDFRVGDAVRAVGTLIPGCNTICSDADGCIGGGKLYDPSVFPCGQALPNFPADILTNACSSVGSTVLMLTLAGLWLTRPRGVRRHSPEGP